MFSEGADAEDARVGKKAVRLSGQSGPIKLNNTVRDFGTFVRIRGKNVRFRDPFVRFRLRLVRFRSAFVRNRGVSCDIDGSLPRGRTPGAGAETAYVF